MHSVRVLEASKQQLVQRLLAMKIDLERSRAQVQPLQQQLADLREAGRRAGEDLAAARGELRAEREKNAVAVAEIEALNAALRKKQGELAAAKRAADGLELDAAEALRSSQRAEAAAQAKGAVAE